MISALMVTQPGRAKSALEAMADFVSQTHRDRELVVVHDADTAFDETLRAAAARHGEVTIRIVRTRPNQTLGALRNRCLSEADGDFVCQWDDDDRYHPERLATQWKALHEARADFSFLQQQMHFFADTGEMFLVDWDGEAYPMNFIQGSMMARRSLVPDYPSLPRGEDTPVAREILRRGHAIARIADRAWTYVYTCHEANAWSVAHHRAIAQSKGVGAARLLQSQATIESRLAQYDPPLADFRLTPGGARPGS
ncbi:glycosyltransferase family 2 protein [Wenzhouxiangella sp. EGI_FJ10305]|uniref:glycosyltransferase family 2 protein n=1 Tax=Wenzhouxiangella sp. EGI_FJ10305 TaxID=3243768 RepID=UPI0035DB5D1A